jgi:S-adenosylmethionine uptake transporter
MPVLAAVLAIGLLSGLDGAVKAVAADHPIPQVVALRFGFGVALSLVLALAVRAPLPGRGGFRRAAVRGLAILGTTGLFFTALTRLPLAEAIAITFISPFMMVLASRVLLGEPITGRSIVAIGIGFAGVLFMLAGNMASGIGGDPVGYALAISASLTYAVAIVLTRRDSGSDPVVTLVLAQNVIVALAALPVGLSTWVTPDLDGWLLFFLAGLLGTAGHVILAFAYSRAPATRLAPLEYTAFLWAAGLGWVFWNEIPTLATLVGAGLIIAAAITTSPAPAPVDGS